MIYKASFENSKSLDRDKYLICFIAKKIPKDLTCDYLLKDLLPKTSLYRKFENKYITEKEFIKEYKFQLKDNSNEFQLTDILELLNNTTKILSKDIVLCGGNLCEVVCQVLEEVTGTEIKTITE